MFGIYSPTLKLYVATDYDYAPENWGGTYRYAKFADAQNDLRELKKLGCIDPCAFVVEIHPVYILNYRENN